MNQRQYRIDFELDYNSELLTKIDKTIKNIKKRALSSSNLNIWPNDEISKNIRNLGAAINNRQKALNDMKIQIVNMREMRESSMGLSGKGMSYSRDQFAGKKKSKRVNKRRTNKRRTNQRRTTQRRR